MRLDPSLAPSEQREARILTAFVGNDPSFTLLRQRQARILLRRAGRSGAGALLLDPGDGSGVVDAVLRDGLDRPRAVDLPALSQRL